jgi:hypothetical protein
MLERLLAVRKPLEKTVTDTDWDAYYRRADRDTKTQLDVVKKIVMDDINFWSKVKELLKLMLPFFDFMRLVDGNKAVMGKIYYKAFEVSP